jgi:hypothetical protein
MIEFIEQHQEQIKELEKEIIVLKARVDALEKFIREIKAKYGIK